MRPNIDIDWAIHGRIKDYAEANDLNLSEAYAEVLEAGLEVLETQDQQWRGGFFPELTRFTPALFAPRIRLSVGTLVTHGKGGILSLNQDSGLIVSDTSPLLNLALIDRLDLLRTQFSDVTVPRRVWNELTEGEAGLEALRELRNDDVLRIVEVERSDLFVEVFHELDLGETAAICYAVEQGANLVLLDERDGRRVARRHDLEVTGVIGILLRGAKTDRVDLEQELDALREAGFWISDDLYARALSDVDE